MTSVPNPDIELEGLGLLCEAASGRNLDEALIRSEERGQRQLCASTQLPVRGSEGEVWAKMGVTFGPVVERELFRDATLPPGWSKQASPDHHMYSHLIDDKGRRRAQIFYKAAFYDRDANMHAIGRFSIRQNLDHYDGRVRDKSESPVQYRVLDGDTVVWSTVHEKVEHLPTESRIEFLARVDAVEDTHRAQACAWLDERYPQWRDASAHWDD